MVRRRGKYLPQPTPEQVFAALLSSLAIVAGWCALAFIGGWQEAYQQVQSKVTLSQVLGTGWCDGDGQPSYATYYHYEPNVIDIHCTDGTTVSAPRR